MTRYTKMAVLLGCLLISSLTAGDKDWPMWRHDAGRSGATPHKLPAMLKPQWTRRLPPLTPCWEDPVNIDRMPFDRCYEPIVVGSTMYLGSNRSDCVIALDTRTGAEKWRTHVDGPVRFPCAAWNGSVYFTSDDGGLYCIDGMSGKIRWRFSGAPSGRRLLGNSRMISAWPARGGVVVHDGKAYFAAGIWPAMGTFIYAVDAKTGKQVWLNDSLSMQFSTHPHGAKAFGLLAPQGAIAAVGDKLILPGGRTLPACLDAATGALRYFNYGDKGQGTSQICASNDVFLNYRSIMTTLSDTAKGDTIAGFSGASNPVLAGGVLYLGGKEVRALDLKNRKIKQSKSSSSRKKKKKKKSHKSLDIPTLWTAAESAAGDLIRTGDRVFGASKGGVFALDLKGKKVWAQKINGTVDRLIAADDRLFVVTREGAIHAFGASGSPKQISPATAVLNPTPQASTARQMLADVPVRKGVCLAYDASGDLLSELVRQSQLHVVAICSSNATVDKLRERFDHGFYGTRISVHASANFQTPQYVAALTVCESKVDLGRICRGMRPYGGVAYIAATNVPKLPGFTAARRGRYTVLTRQGPLPGAAPWTHQYGNAANTAKSNDKLAKPPFGILWFGGSTHQDVLPRHGHGPSEQVIGGRLFIEGDRSLSARDVYTGFVLWKREFDDLGNFGVYFDKSYKTNPLDTSYNQGHIPGANAHGTNYVVTADAVYLLKGEECLVLDPATGSTTSTFRLPKRNGKLPKWGYIGACRNFLIATATPLGVPIDSKSKVRISKDLSSVENVVNASASRTLVVMDRRTGKVLWSRDAKFNFRHNAIAAGGDAIYCLDAMSAAKRKYLQKQGVTLGGTPTLYALDLRSGAVKWQETATVFGTWLAYSAERDMVIQSGRASRDMVRDEVSNRVVAYRASTGKILWDAQGLRYSGIPILHHNALYFDAGSLSALDLNTGKPLSIRHPITGQPVQWQYKRQYGCNAPYGSEYFLSFRSGGAGFCDLASAGVGNLGGFKSSCTTSLIAADGVLNAPDYTRTCNCNYQNQTSLAFVAMPEAEMWTYTNLPIGDRVEIRRCGFNFGAPGDRMADDGTLWLEYPNAGSPSPSIPVVIDKALKPYCHHVSRFKSDWIAASGLKGSGTISIATVSVKGKPSKAQPATYTVSLYFANPDGRNRTFDVSLQGKKVLPGFSPAGRTCLRKTFKGVKASGTITVQLTGDAVISGVAIVKE